MVVHQMKNELDIYQIINKQEEMETRLDIHQSRLDNLEQASLPMGFIYIEIPDQSSPQQLWPSLQWTEVTQQYVGLFYGAEGSGSRRFGKETFLKC